MSEIKYTRNIVNKLKLLGFEFCYEQDPFSKISKSQYSTT